MAVGGEADAFEGGGLAPARAARSSTSREMADQGVAEVDRLANVIAPGVWGGS